VPDAVRLASRRRDLGNHDGRPPVRHNRDEDNRIPASRITTAGCQQPFAAVAIDRNSSSLAASHRVVSSSLLTWATTSLKFPGPARHLAARHRAEPTERTTSISGSAATSAGSRRRIDAQPRRKAAVRRGQSGALSAVELQSAAMMSCTRKPTPTSSKSSSRGHLARSRVGAPVPARVCERDIRQRDAKQAGSTAQALERRFVSHAMVHARQPPAQGGGPGRRRDHRPPVECRHRLRHLKGESSLPQPPQDPVLGADVLNGQEAADAQHIPLLSPAHKESPIVGPLLTGVGNAQALPDAPQR
jgi:hypothetical protein